jgi:predicted transcriptional regulator
MAAVETTTLRVPVELRDEIARIAEERGTTMLDVVSDAIHRLTRDEWWATVHAALEMSDEEAAGYRREAELLDNATADGLRAS